MALCSLLIGQTPAFCSSTSLLTMRRNAWPDRDRPAAAGEVKRQNAKGKSTGKDRPSLPVLLPFAFCLFLLRSPGSAAPPATEPARPPSDRCGYTCSCPAPP